MFRDLQDIIQDVHDLQNIHNMFIIHDDHNLHNIIQDDHDLHNIIMALQIKKSMMIQFR
jgi:hypothetical protein